MAMPSSPFFDWRSDPAELNDSINHDNISSLPIPPAEVCNETSQTKTSMESAELPENLPPSVSDYMTTQSNQMLHDFPVQPLHFQSTPPFTPNQPLSIPGYFSNSELLASTTTSDELAVLPASSTIPHSLMSGNSQVRGNQNSDFSIHRCIKMFYALPQYEKFDIRRVVEIFRDEYNRQAFVAMKRRHKLLWLEAFLGGTGK